MRTLIRRRKKLIGHKLRHDVLIKTIFEAEVDGRKGPGRPGMMYMKQMKEDVREKKYVGEEK